MNEDCCSSEEAGSIIGIVDTRLALSIQPSNGCPACHEVGLIVSGQTVKALLAVSLREVVAKEYYYCRTPACPIVYYADDYSRNFAVDELRESVYQKETNNPDVLVCYCFRHKVRDVVNASAEFANTILNDITSGIEAGQCACDLRNPQGSCCLGNVRVLVKQSQ